MNKKVENKEEVQAVDLLDILLDKDNKEPITLMDEKGKQISFEQIAMIVHEVKKRKKALCNFETN